MKKSTLVAVALGILLQVGLSSAEAALMTVTLTAPSFFPFPYATDLHVKLSSTKPITISGTSSGNPGSPISQVPLQPARVTGNFSTEVQLDWNTFPGNVVFKGEQVHIGFSGSTPSCLFCDTAGVFITESYWTSGGERIGPTTGMLSPVFIPPAEFGPSTQWIVGRLDLFVEEGPMLLRSGTMWWEWEDKEVISASFFNFGTEPVFASVAFASFPDMIPLDSLNESLTGFGPASPVQLFMPVPFAAVPEPASILLLGAGLMGLLAARRCAVQAPRLCIG